MELENPVEKYVRLHHHSLKEVMIQLRNTLLLNFPNVHEHIKWNAPSYQLNGADFLTFNTSNPTAIRLIFHRDVKVKNQLKTPFINDESKILKWASNDRAIATFSSLEQVENNTENLVDVVSKWIQALQNE